MDPSSWMSSGPHSRLQPLYPFMQMSEHKQGAAREEHGEVLGAGTQEHPDHATACDRDERSLA
jgi:hypothetical protein